MDKNKYVVCEDNTSYEINCNGEVRKRGYDLVYDNGDKIHIEPEIVEYKNYGPYLGVYLDKKKYAVHRLLAKAFLPNKDNLPHVKFKDGNKHNISIDNLEWSEYINGNESMKKDSKKYGAANGIKVLCKNDGKIFNSVMSASKHYGINYSTFSYRFMNKKPINGLEFTIAPKNSEPNVFI